MYARDHSGLRRDLIDWIDPLNDDGSSADPGDLVSVANLSPNRVFIRYQARTSGILTLTDSYSPGWTATVNGSPSEILSSQRCVSRRQDSSSRSL